MSVDDGDLSGMLEELADADYRPVVHPATDGTGWVAYSQAPCRVSFVGEGPDPESAVRRLYVHTFGDPTVPSPAPERPAAPSPVQPSRGQPSREPQMSGGPDYGLQVALRPSPALCEALHAMAERARTRAMDAPSNESSSRAPRP